MIEPFRTALSQQESPFRINHTHPVLLMGSCFTEHIGQRLADRKFNTLVNPYGIVYNPVSLAENLLCLMEGNCAPASADLVEHQGLWHSWSHHGRFSGPHPDHTLADMQEAYQRAVDFIQKASVLILTFGTAEVSILRSSGRVVANNHKMPANLFEYRRLTLNEIVEAWLPLLQQWSGKKVVLTVSPVRHLRQGLIENQRSKAALVLACADLCPQLPFVSYFPSYELLLDDLRDYRFYEADMLHPSQVAVDYIWNRFSDTYLEAESRQLGEQIMKIRAAMNHRPFHANTPEHLAFRAAQLDKIKALQAKFPAIDMTLEEQYFSQAAKEL
ncbi:MAG: GSCFA domain-containing protein [Saprospiraceae bacterium]|nr:GSCFA domain-containing protein [Saprospiraceae bacterium]